MLIHGGSWQARYGKWLMRGLAADLLRGGWVVWNVEYRAVGEGRAGGGGWPMTFADVAAGVDLLAEIADDRVDLGRAVVVGHSAGGQLALWVASPRSGGPGGPPRVRFRAAVGQAAVAAMADAHAGQRDGSVHAVMGAAPDEAPERYDAVDPVRQVPLGLPVLLVHGTQDTTVPVRRSRTFATAARAAGDDVELVELAGRAGDHSRHIDPGGEGWAVARDWLDRLGL